MIRHKPLVPTNGWSRGLVSLLGSGIVTSCLPPGLRRRGAGRGLTVGVAPVAGPLATLKDAYLEVTPRPLDDMWWERLEGAAQLWRTLAPRPIRAAVELVRRDEGVGWGPARRG